MADFDTTQAGKVEPAVGIGRPSRIPWPPILLAGTILLSLALGRVVPLPWPGVDDTPARLIGYGLGALGLLLAAWAVITLWRSGTTVRPDAAASVLVTSGPYGRYRNPIYLADVLIILGLAQVTYNVWFAILAPVFAVLVTWLAILPEERHLAERFGDEWAAYKERSRRWI